jgi:hypothetical protein
MTKFLVIYYSSKEDMKKMENVSPEEAKKGMEPWMQWAQKCGDGLVDLGAPLGNGQKVAKSGATPTDKDVTGYSILQAENMEKAQEMLKDHPHLEWSDECEIEIYEAMPM